MYVHHVTTRAALAAGLMMAVAGCVSNEAATTHNISNLAAGSDYGAIHGLVVDEALFPISGALVTLEADGRSTKTNVDGAFAFIDVPVGEQVLIIHILGYQTASAKASVIVEETTHIDVTMVRVASAEAYYVAKIGRGLFGCGATYRQGFTTINNAFFGVAACGAGNQYTGLDDFIWDTMLSDNITIWRGAAFETQWRSNQVLGNGMVQDWAVFDCANNRNATFTRDTGPSPLHAVLGSFQLDYRLQDLPNSSCKGHERCNLKECHIMNRMFSWPSTLGQNSLIDVGVTIQQTFTTYLTEFYRAEPDPDFTAMPDV